jgi:transglutaminase-like putative cysteine protease
MVRQAFLSLMLVLLVPMAFAEPFEKTEKIANNLVVGVERAIDRGAQSTGLSREVSVYAGMTATSKVEKAKAIVLGPNGFRKEYKISVNEDSVDGRIPLEGAEGFHKIALVASTDGQRFAILRTIYRNKYPDRIMNYAGGKVSKQIQKIAAQITSGITDVTKQSLAIHDWVARNIAYDYKDFDSSKEGDLDATEQSANRALDKRKAVASGYANLMIALHHAQGIPIKYVSGKVRVKWDGFNGYIEHSWNRIYLNGKWIDVDATFDRVRLPNGRFKVSHAFFNFKGHKQD